AFIDSHIDPTLVDPRCNNSKNLTDYAEAAHQTIPEITVHPVGELRARPSEGDDRARIQLIDVHLVCEQPKQRRLRIFERINFRGSISIPSTSFSIKPNTQRHTSADKYEGNEKHRLNQARELEVNGFACEITMQPWPRRREHHTQENCADRWHDHRHLHD